MIFIESLQNLYYYCFLLDSQSVDKKTINNKASNIFSIK